MDHLTYELLTQRRDDVKLSNDDQVITFLEWRAKLENMFERRMSEKVRNNFHRDWKSLNESKWNGNKNKQKQGFQALFILTALKEISCIVL